MTLFKMASYFLYHTELVRNEYFCVFSEPQSYTLENVQPWV